VDALRARALRGDALEECSESDREWVWRSLLKGVRLAEACVLAHLDLEDMEQLDGVLDRIRRAYHRHSQQYREQHASPASPVDKQA
jgi:hypothetical protein